LAPGGRRRKPEWGELKWHAQTSVLPIAFASVFASLRHDYRGDDGIMDTRSRTATGSRRTAGTPGDPPTELHTTAGDVALHEYRATFGDHTYTILHTGAVLTFLDEQILLSDRETGLPYGVALWPAAIALAHEIAARGDDARGRHVLELGAGTGLPGIVAASLGARVVQTDRQQAALALGRLNVERNGVAGIEHRLADWTAWNDTARYDWIIGSDILYAAAMHPHLTRIFESNVGPGGRILLADPFRRASFALLESLEAAGWAITVSKWSVGEEAEPSPVGVFELSRGGGTR
jgi:predicted nicotinamide N-methyase